MIQCVYFLLLCFVGSSISAPSAPISPDYPNVKVVGGIDAQRGEFPYQISYQKRLTNGTWIHYCGGSIMGHSWILTAAHCIEREANISNYRVVAGILNQNESETDIAQIIGIDKQIIHENYPWFAQPAPDDIALVKLSSFISYNDDVRYIPLPPENLESDGNVTLTGWGLTDPFEDSYPNTLQKVQAPLLNATVCEEIFAAIFEGLENPFNVEANLCSGPLSGGIAPCSGDSGGPLVQNGTLIGIVSWGNLLCGSENSPSVYTKVSDYIEWIQDNTFGEVTVG